MSQNHATIYSNGIAELSRTFAVEKSSPRKISIPVRQEHLADVLASLTIRGEVKLDTPPSYQPANVDDGNLHIDSGNALVALARQLTGASLSVALGGDLLEGVLVGLQDQMVGQGGEPYPESYLIVLCDGAMRRVPVKEIRELKFTDPVIQNEIDKALSRGIRKIKPNSTFVDFELSTGRKQAKAVVQYTIPAAAWKISYRLVLQEKGIELHGHAIVDNNTDEDWTEFLVSVVMGQPITFTSDLADSKTPRRSHVNIVQESAVGAVEVEDKMVMMDSMAVEMSAPAAPAARGIARKKQRAGAGTRFGAVPDATAEMDEAEVSESGDFCVFRSQHPVSIDARRSAVIPVFQTEMDESQVVLHYKHANHAERPFRSIRFKNSLEHSLGRGICTVLDAGSYAGSCIIPAMKTGQESLLPHALDTGVKITQKRRESKTRRIRVQVSDGVGIETYYQRVQTDYHINNRSEAIPLVLDHDVRYSNGALEFHLVRQDADAVRVESSELQTGRRVDLDLQEGEQLVLSVIETKTRTQRVHLGDPTSNVTEGVRWIRENLIEADSPLASDPAVTHVIELKRQFDELNLQVEHAQSEIVRLEKRQERLRKNIEAGGGEQQDQRWRGFLGKTEDAIYQLEEERIPELKRQSEAVRLLLLDALKTLALDWAE